MKVLLLTQPMPAAPYVEAISKLAPELELVEYRSALGDADLVTIDIALGWRLMLMMTSSAGRRESPTRSWRWART